MSQDKRASYQITEHTDAQGKILGIFRKGGPHACLERLQAVRDTLVWVPAYGASAEPQAPAGHPPTPSAEAWAYALGLPAPKAAAAAVPAVPPAPPPVNAGAVWKRAFEPRMRVGSTT